jgi:hypothetical protein
VALRYSESGPNWNNTGTSPANIEVNFFDNNSNPLSLPLIFLDSGETTTNSTLTQTIAAGATIVVATNAGSTPALVTGSAQLTSSGGNAGGFAVFHFSPSAQEAVVPIQTQNAAAYVLAFDNTNGLATGLALANVSNQAVKVPMIVRDDTGTQLGTATIGLAAHGHTSFVLPATYSFAKDTRDGGVRHAIQRPDQRAGNSRGADGDFHHDSCAGEVGLRAASWGVPDGGDRAINYEGGVGFARPLHRPLLHRRHYVRDLRRGSDLPVPLGALTSVDMFEPMRY